ncbi:MAG: long-chain fatty acid--CoA ligase [Balneolales bacterium]|nr:long-chain fatty acid--CoA ligase [Balneolales bacterium]
MSLIVDFNTIPEMFYELSMKWKGKQKTAFAFKPSGDEPYSEIKWEKVIKDVNALSAYMLDNGMKPGDRFAILSENRYEWAVVDFAGQLAGGINVSLYATLPPEQCEYIINDSESKFFFVSTGIQLKKAVEIKSNTKSVKQIIAFDTPPNKSLLEQKDVFLFDQVLEKGREKFQEYADRIVEIRSNVKPEDTSTFIYTSGTTGNPKGVMLSNNNLVSNVKAAHKIIDIGPDDRTLSFLPLCHAFERVAGYYAIMGGGAEIFYAESVDTVSKNLTEARPTIVISVPRLFEKMYNIVLKNVQAGSNIKQGIFNWSINVGRKSVKSDGFILGLQKKIADRLVFNKLKERTGGRVRIFVSGGAALPADIGNFFQAAGLRITEGYGLTETSPVMTVNPFGGERYGTVGHVLHGVTVGIQRVADGKVIAQLSGDSYPSNLSSEEGEILCKGPNVMQGYYKKEKETKEVIDDDGWFHTGDIGRFDNGYLQITDRLKHMIVNAGGKNIYPGPIEDGIKTSLYVDQAVVVGEAQQFMSALIVPDFEALRGYCKQNNIEAARTDHELINQEEIKKLFDKELRLMNKKLASHEKVRQFRLLLEPFTVENGILTPTMKVKRKVLEQRYADLIAQIYAED